MIASLKQLSKEAEARPLDFIQWTPPQWAFLIDTSRYKCLRLSEQLGGKTTAGLAACIDYALGTEKFVPRAHKGPVTIWIVCHSDRQSVSIQSKLNKLLPWDLVDDSTEFINEAKGFRGRNTAIVFKNGSVILFKTTKSGVEALKSGTVHMILMDEPSTEECYQQCKSRLRRTNGFLLCTLTPIHADCSYLKEDVDRGLVSDHCYPLTVENCTPIGSSTPLALEDGTPISEAYIQQLRAETPAHLAATSLDGEWEARGTDRYFDVFVMDPSVPGSHVTPLVPAGVELALHLGVDHGDRPGKQMALLVGIEHVTTTHVKVWVLDEYTDPTGEALPEDDARGILDMLGRHRWEWSDLDFAMGDRVHLPGSGRQKSNRDLMVQIGRAMGMPNPNALRPIIRTAKRGEGRGRGSVSIGARWIYHAMVRGSFHVHPRCKRLIAALNEWTGPGPDSEAKDPVDALRYALDPIIYQGRKAVDVRIAV